MKNRLLKDKSNTLQAPDVSFKPIGKMVPGVLSTFPASTTVTTATVTSTSDNLESQPVSAETAVHTEKIENRPTGTLSGSLVATSVDKPIPHSYARRHAATPPTNLGVTSHMPQQRQSGGVGIAEIRPVMVSTINGKATSADGARVNFLSSLAR